MKEYCTKWNSENNNKKINNNNNNNNNLHFDFFHNN